MKKQLSLIFFAVLLVSVFAQTNIPGGDVSGNWNLAGSPYIVQGNIMLGNGQTLTIEGGVEIQFEGEYRFDIEGQLITNNDEDNWITFTTHPANAIGWNGLRFFGQNYASDNQLTIGFVEILNARHEEQNLPGGGLFLENCNQYFILHNIKVHNSSSNRYGGGIYMKDSNPKLSKLEVSHCSAAWSGGGMYLFNSSPNIQHGLIVNNTTERSGGGIATYFNSAPVINKTTISDNSAIENGPAIAAMYNSNVTIRNSIVFRNYFGDYLNGYSEVYKVASAVVNATYSLLRNGTGETYFGTGCIDTNPLFNEEGLTGYELTTESPCIDAGDPNPQYNDPDDTRADMGRFYYEQTGFRGTVAMGSIHPDATITFDDISIVVFEGWSNANPIDTLVVNSEGRYYMELETGGNYRLRCRVNYPLHGANPNLIDAAAIEGQLVNLDPNVNTASFVINQVPAAYVRGRVRIYGLNLNNNMHYDIEITSNADDGITNPYRVLDIWGNVIEWRFEHPIPSGYEWDISLSLDGYQAITYSVPPLAPGEFWNIDFDEPVFILDPVPFYGDVSGKITLKPDPDFGLPTIDMTQAIVYWDYHLDSSTNPNQDGTYFLPDVQVGYRTITVEHPQLATIQREGIYVPIDSEVEDVDFTMLPWVQTTGNQYSMTAYVTTSLDAQFLAKNQSNVVAAFGPDGTCRGVGIWVEGNHPYWCNEIYYYSLPGYWYFTIVSNQQFGEFITFKGYDTDTDQVFHFDNASILFENDTHNSAKNLVDSFTDYDFTYDLIDDWNWISINMYLDDYSINSFFSGVNAEIVKNQTQSSEYFDTIGWVGDLHTLSNYESYKTLMTNSGQLTITGNKMNSVIHPVFLGYPATGSPAYWWHWISYLNPNDESLPLEVAIESIESNIVSIKSQTKSAINDGGWFGDLTHLEVGKGYLVDISAEGWLSYPGMGYYDSKSNSTPFEHSNPAKWEMITGNTANMVLIAELGVDETYQAGVFDAYGNCRSIGKYEGDFWYFTVLGYDAEEELFIHLYNIEKGVSQTSLDSFEYAANTLKGARENPIIFQFDNLDADIEVPMVVELNQNYPNPFNPITTFSYSIPTEGNVKLQVFNVKGQLVETLVDKVQSADSYELTWDASQFGTGIYFYRLSVDNKVEHVKKCIMLK